MPEDFKTAVTPGYATTGICFAFSKFLLCNEDDTEGHGNGRNRPLSLDFKALSYDLRLSVGVSMVCDWLATCKIELF